MFSQVSVCPRGVPASLHAGIHTPQTRGRHPWADSPSRADTPLDRHLPLPSTCWDMVNKRAVCIPLECILVHIFISLYLHSSVYRYHLLFWESVIVKETRHNWKRAITMRWIWYIGQLTTLFWRFDFCIVFYDDTRDRCWRCWTGEQWQNH